MSVGSARGGYPPERSAVRRVGRRTRVKPAAEAQYRDWHRRVWPEIVALTREAGIRNYSIFMDGVELFSYFEVDDLDRAISFLSRSEISDRWQALMAPLMDADSAASPWVVLEEVFHQD
jgi:L-rhamnose mutarotase